MASRLQSPGCQPLAGTRNVRMNCVGSRKTSFFEVLFGPSNFGATWTCKRTCVQQTPVSERTNTGFRFGDLGVKRWFGDRSLHPLVRYTLRGERRGENLGFAAHS